MRGLENLSNEVLIKSYKEALSLNLDTDFVMLLVGEIKKRGIEGVEIQPFKSPWKKQAI